MAHPSKRKGSRFERLIVSSARQYGLSAKRAYASNGLSLGEIEEVDIIIENIRVQAKIRRKLSCIVRPSPNVDIQVIREDRGKAYIVAELDLFLKWMQEIKAYRETIKGDSGKSF